MKKLLTSLCVLALALVCIFALPTAAEAATEGDYKYSVSDGEAIITRYTGTGGDITIPSTLGGYPVVAITGVGDEIDFTGAFAYCDSLTSVTIPNSMTSIGEFAFYCCKNLTAVIIPDGVTTIGDRAFCGCDSLTGIWVNSGNADFSSDEGGVLFNKDMTTLIQAPGGMAGSYAIPDSVTTICNSAFSFCYSLSSVTIPDSVTSIGVWTFRRCQSLTSVTIPNGVTTIEESAFDECSSLTSVVIPNSVTSIGFYAFDECANLTSVTIGCGVTTIDACAFFECDSLTDVYYNGTEAQWEDITIGRSNECLLNATFHFATLEDPGDADYEYTVENGEATITGYNGAGGDITIPDTLGGYPVTAIGRSAFFDCSSLTSVTIPASVTTIGEYVFVSCNSLTGIWVSSGNNNFVSDESGVLFNKDKTTLIQAPGGITGDYTIPDSVTTIGKDAFYWCENLTSVTIPTSVRSIGEAAFDDCDSLDDVYYSGTEAQWNNIAIGDFNILLYESAIHFAGETETPNEAGFEYTIENGEATITGYNGDGGDIVIPATLGGYPVIAITGEHVDEECYYGAFYGCNSLTSVIIPDSVTTIGFETFRDCDSLISVTISDSVTTIGEYAFSWCNSLTSVTIGDSVATIGEYAFACCTSLTNVTIPDSVTTIGVEAFGDCDSLINVTIGNNVTTIGMFAFYDCNSLTSVTIPGGVTSIGYGAFRYCTSLTSVTIGDGVSTIGEYAFSRCNSLTSVTIGDTVTTIGNYAFDYCTSLTDVYYNGTATQWENITIGEGNEPLLNATIYYNHGPEHSFTAKVTAPTCTVKGYTTYTCACGDTYKANYVNATGHRYDAGKVTKAATCKAAGVKTYTCKVCKATKTATIAKLTKHTYDNSCDTTCNVCSAKRTITHSYDAGKVTKAATCKATGVKTYTCKVCKATKTTAIAKLTKHTYDNNCDTACNVCNAKRTIKHAYKTTTTKATLSKNGKIVKKCTVCGKVASTKAIKRVKTVKLSATSYTYNGKAKTPTVTVKDSAGKTLKKNTDYTVTYASGRKNVGTYKVTIKLKGNYSGTKTLTFKIVPKAASINKLTAKSKAISVKLNRSLKQSTGYQIQYSTSSKFASAKTVNVTSYKTSTKTISGLKKGKKYYVRVRTYKTVGKTKFYSAWSSFKSVKTK